MGLKGVNGNYEELEFVGGVNIVQKCKLLLRLLASFIICFVIIYAVVFAGGWKLFESGDPILIEIGASMIGSLFLFVILEIFELQEQKIKKLEERIKNLETINNDNKK